MKAQKAISVLATLSILSFTVACNSDQDVADAFADGKAEGYKEGYDAGDKAGYTRAQAYFATADYTDGYNDGKTAGISIGYTNGYNVGKGDGYTQGYNVGKADGYTQGYNVGKKDGYTLGYSDGYDDGDADGYADGYAAGDAQGYKDGYSDGYDDGEYDGYQLGFKEGYDVGWDDAVDYYGFSVGKTPKLKGYADLLSGFHNKVFDYSKIQAPVETKRGLVVNGSLLLSETSTTNKDTLKRAAVVEQYVVGEMAKQVNAKFGLSAERSLKVAKAANHFRKFANNRAITPEDSNAYAKEIIGADFKEISKAYEGSMKGNFSEFNSILEKAAEKNGVSPEKMGEIVTKMFL